jgi:hypothetical protein
VAIVANILKVISSYQCEIGEIAISTAVKRAPPAVFLHISFSKKKSSQIVLMTKAFHAAPEPFKFSTYLQELG